MTAEHVAGGSGAVCTRSDCERDRDETGECHCSVYGGSGPEGASIQSPRAPTEKSQSSGAGSTVDFATWWDEIKKSDRSRFGTALAAWRLGEERASELHAALAAARSENEQLKETLKLFGGDLRLTKAELAQAQARIAELEKRPDIDLLSALVHEAWMVEQRKLGRMTRRSQSGEEFMVPYDALSEEAKEFDRATVRAVLAALDAARETNG